MKEKEKIESKNSEIMKSKQNLEIEKREFGIEKDLFQIYIKEENEKIGVNKMNNKKMIEIYLIRPRCSFAFISVCVLLFWKIFS